MPSSKLFKWHTVWQQSEVDEEIRLSDKSLSIGLIMQVIYHWAFAVAPALCPPYSLHSQKWGARAPPGCMAPAPLITSTLSLTVAASSQMSYSAYFRREKIILLTYLLTYLQGQSAKLTDDSIHWLQKRLDEFLEVLDVGGRSENFEVLVDGVLELVAVWRLRQLHRHTRSPSHGVTFLDHLNYDIIDR